jgi:hypothetical protein
MEILDKPLGAFSASRVGDLFVGGTDGFTKTSQSYLLDLALEIVNNERVEKFSTKATNHGLVSQFEAFEEIIQKKYEVSEWHDRYIPITDYFGATPDSVVNFNDPCDVKCPFYIDTFFDHKSKLKNIYFYQMQTQMIATSGETSYLCFYLTTSEADEWGNKLNEYPFPLSDRHFFTEVKRDNEVIDSIYKRVEQSKVALDELVSKLEVVEPIPESEFFYKWFYQQSKFRKLKQAYNILSEKNKIICLIKNDKKEFYTEIK